MALIGRHALIGACAGSRPPYHVEWDETVDRPLYTARRLRVPPGREAGRRRPEAADDSAARGPGRSPTPRDRTAVMQP
ncbi:hypothetical protein GCM10009546_40020 [Actinomadura livida]|uniref:DUF1918 domain-containing protein n=1 Tax=Actinomadura livida TaxID=79909 RepID=A0ABP3PX60_9ACTN|nr:hypothetical protein GCM10010208_48420 [Actinomadura livida]